MKYIISALIPVLIFFSGCSSLKVTYDMDKSVDFNKYKTFEYYGWQKDSGKLLNDLDKKRIETAFGEEFRKRGLQYVKENGDLIVTLFIVTQKKTETTANTTMMGGGAPYGYYGGFYGYGPGWGWGMGHATTTYSNYDYEVGTLVCDVFDAKQKRLIWEGIGEGTIKENTKNRDKNIPKAVAAIMKDYPVKPIE